MSPGLFQASQHFQNIWNGLVHAGFEVLTAVAMKIPIFWGITPCTRLKINRVFGGTCHLHLQGRRRSEAINQVEENSKQNLVSSSILKMEAICSSETSVDFEPTTRRYIPEDRTSQISSFLHIPCQP
jgi:hypothetical protein